MRWKDDKPVPFGTKRVTRFFAWLPVRIRGETRFLEFVEVEQVMLYFRHWPTWHNIRFVHQKEVEAPYGWHGVYPNAVPLPAPPKASPAPPPKRAYG